ncbi:hypothetical protein H5410_008627 [Solanum commersonii]|uniref:Uncharacterized protein n=1 Tax=Solanum commersonii TaxID=4109 RepID=A0A9J6AG77_SOLCO|nr:hypothetical protein H5410_008627 [Solanum commersonii]
MPTHPDHPTSSTSPFDPTSSVLFAEPPSCDVEVQHDLSPFTHEIPTIPASRKSTRQTKPPIWLKDVLVPLKGPVSSTSTCSGQWAVASVVQFLFRNQTSVFTIKNRRTERRREIPVDFKQYLSSSSNRELTATAVAIVDFKFSIAAAAVVNSNSSRGIDFKSLVAK